MKEYLGNYRGIVIQNNDPHMRGRIKVFIPNVSSNIYTNWDQDNDDKIFNFIDNPDVQKIIEEVKEVLPWAEYAGPIFGGSASARYNATLKEGVVSDTNSFEGNEPTEGYRPLNMYANELAYPDAFSASGKVGNRSVNPYANQYIPANYSNLAKGMFSIPNVGSHVWVWFIGGDSNQPVYFASSYGEEDIKRIFTNSQKTGLEGEEASSLHYPGTYENIVEDELSSDGKTFRSKHVINSNKNSIEMIDTDGFERLRLTQYGGSFIDMTNETTIKMSTNNDQSMVLGDTFETHQKDKNEFIGGVNDRIIHGDSYEKVGNQNSFAVNEIFDNYKIIHEYKTLFDVKRTNANSVGGRYEQNVTSPYQEQEGSYGICPVCNNIPYAQKLWRLNPLHNRINLFLPLPDPGWPGQSLFTPVSPPTLANIGDTGFVEGGFCPLCNDPVSPYFYENPGFSSSTVNGNWNVEDRKLSDGVLGDLYKSTSSQILDLQNSLGNGGDSIKNISRNFVLNVGLAMNNLQSYRVDATGKLKSVGVYVAPEGTIIKPAPTPHVEHVDVDPLPGGDYIITAGNKMKFLAGANGINIKTFGPIEMYGSITNLTSEQMNILAKHELFIDGGEKLSLRGRHISLNPFEQNPVLVEGGLHVSKNAIIKGGMHVDGELGVQHVTGPSQWYKTEPSGGLTMLVNTLIPLGSPSVEPHVHPVIIKLPDHEHYFESLSMDLKSCKEEARSTMVQLGINSNVEVNSQSVKYPNPASGEVNLAQPVGGIVNQAQAEATLADTPGLPYSSITNVFNTISQVSDVSQFNDLYSTFQTNADGVTSSVNAQTEAINEVLRGNLGAVEDAIADIYSS